MSQDLEELFGEGSGAPQPRLRRVVILLVVGMITALLGLACSSVPGGALILLAWVAIEKEMDRVESGFLPADARRPIARLRTITLVSVVLVVLLFFVQLFLMCGGYYDLLWRAALTMLGGTLGS
ncbi:MAG TPA: hypothetical protein ENK18_14900 [Deltaproteobacteria bacterium]|nr:hypothetical protein [Deltaproteobacteria bacterium]